MQEKGQKKHLASELVNEGFVHLQLGNYAEALKCFQIIRGLEPDNPETYNNLGYTYECMERYGTAKQMYRRALELQPGSIETMVSLGHISELEGDYFGAAEKYQRAVAKAPDAAVPHFFLAVLYDRHDMFDEAVAEYEAVLERDSRHVKALFNLGGLLGQLGEYERGLSLLERVLRLQPDFKEAQNRIELIREKVSKQSAAPDRRNPQLCSTGGL